MTQKKALRRRCDRPACGKLYRHASASSKTCSAACRQRLYVERRQVRQEQLEAARQDKWERRREGMQAAAARERQVESNRQPAPAPRPHTAPPPPAPTPWPYTHISQPEPPEQTIIIRYRKPYTTPL